MATDFNAPGIKREFVIKRQGKEFVLYAGILDLAHAQGLKTIRTHLLQIPADDNGQVAIVSAEIETDRGLFSGIGDASPRNVSSQMLTHIIRLAETRAKARALRDAINIGVAAIEEFGDLDDEPAAAARPATPTPIRQPLDEPPPEYTGAARNANGATAATTQRSNHHVADIELTPTTNGQMGAAPPATAAQIRAITSIAASLNLSVTDVERRFKVQLETLSRQGASTIIDELKKLERRA